MDAPVTGGASGAEGAGDAAPMDGIQAWKAQMKEMERKERERDNPPAPAALPPATYDPIAAERPPTAPVVNQLAPSPSDFSHLGTADVRPGVFENLGSGSGITAPAQASGGTSRTKSRFASKFFDASKGPALSPPIPAQASGLGALLGSGGNGVSKEDHDSMSRLMGMLHVSGVCLRLCSYPH